LTGLAFDDAIRSNLAPFGISSERRLAAYGMADDEEAAPTEVGLLLLRTAMTLPIHILVIVLHPLPAVELARLACVHNVFWRALLSLRQQHPGRRYAKPKESLLANARMWSRLSRAGYYGDVAVIQSIVAAGVDEHGVLLSLALDNTLLLVFTKWTGLSRGPFTTVMSERQSYLLVRVQTSKASDTAHARADVETVGAVCAPLPRPFHPPPHPSAGSFFLLFVLLTIAD
jgi:hypothetical protein